MGVDATIPPHERYEVVGRIASGGMSEIYLARIFTRPAGWRELILKRLRPDLQSESEFVQMFYDEAFVASQMQHPCIAEIIELGELDGSLFMAMELVEGFSLQEL